MAPGRRQPELQVRPARTGRRARYRAAGKHTARRGVLLVVHRTDLHFDGTDSSDPKGHRLYQWIFGDGGTATSDSEPRTLSPRLGPTPSR